MDDAPPGFDPADTPQSVRIARDGSAVTLAWDGCEATTQAVTLREGCRCAWCSRARIDGTPPRARADIAIAEFRPLGRYAVHIAFTDGHRKGVFPWTYLRALATPETAA